jgi:hypothetical protein
MNSKKRNNNCKIRNNIILSLLNSQRKIINHLLLTYNSLRLYMVMNVIIAQKQINIIRSIIILIYHIFK